MDERRDGSLFAGDLVNPVSGLGGQAGRQLAQDDTETASFDHLLEWQRLGGPDALLQ